MGCWNATCSISGLPIGYQDEVYAAIVAIDQEPINNCGPTAVAFPIAPMFAGTYNDYGSVESDDTEIGAAIRIANTCLKTSHSQEDMLGVIVQGDAKYVRLGHYKTRLGLWIAHKHIVDAIGGRGYEFHYYTETRRRVTLTADEAAAAARLGAEDYQALLIGDDIRGQSNFWREMARTTSPFQQRQHLACLARLIEGDVNTNYWATNLNFLLQDMSGAKEELDGIRTWFEQLGRTLHMTRAMEVLRRNWLPASGEGSQATDYDEHAHLAATTAAFAKTLAKRFEE